MNLRDITISARLCLGFGLILLSASVLLVGALVSYAASRAGLLQTLQADAAQEDLAVAMRQALLSGAVAVRSMGLQMAVEGVQKDEAEAKSQRAAYLAARAKLEAGGLDSDDKAIFGRLADIDRQMDTHFKEAVDLAAQFNAEQAAAVILNKIDPLSKRALQALTQYIALQKAHTAAATELVNARSRAVVNTIAAAGALLLGLACLMAWRLTVSVTRPLRTAVEASARVARGDPVSEIELSGRDEATQLLAGLREMRGSLARMVREVRQSSEALDCASSEIAQGNADLSSRTESQASALQQTAASCEHLTGTVKQNADSAAHALQLASHAAEQVERGRNAVGEVISTMGAISGHSRKITDITSVINSIAFQTNILALNAAVEAARAGEQGRGFAVVASEVRILSQRTTAAAKEIETLIRAAADSTQSGSVLVNQAGSAMDGVRESFRQVGDLVRQISAASREQTGGIDEVNRAIADIDRSTQQNAALVEQAAAASESMRDQTHKLNSLVSAFEV